MKMDSWTEHLVVGCSFVLLWFLAGVALDLFRRWTRRRAEDRWLKGPKPPCPHRYIRLRWKVEAGKLVEPKPECVDCGVEVLNVRVQVKE